MHEIAILFALLASSGGAVSAGSVGAADRELVENYCISCHNDELRIGDFSFTELSLDHPERSPEQAEKLIRKLRSGMMPPVGMPRPDTGSLNELAKSIEDRIDAVAAERLFVGAPELHRMNRTEYRNAVRELLDIDIDVSELLPPDATTNGFDNMSEALSITPALMSAYVRAAEKISRGAVGDPSASPSTVLYQVSRLKDQMRHVEGTPFGTRGGTSVLHTFPADGEYSFHLTFYYYYPGQLVGSALPEQLQGQQIEVSVDGERLAVVELDPSIKEETANYVTERVRIQAGQRRLAAAFLSKFDGPVQAHYRQIEQTLADTTIAVIPQLTGLPHLQALSVTGPFRADGVSESRSRRRIFTCRPAPDATREEELDCARRILSELTTKAFRRPATSSDVDGLLEYYVHGAAEGGFDSGVQAAIQAILAKPEFLFRFEAQPPDVSSGETYEIGDLELASRLAFFLWSSLPDEELVRVASEGRLSDPETLAAQLDRMLADGRSEALARNFAGQWLRLAGIGRVFPEALSFPDFTADLARSMRREVELLFGHVMRENESVLDLLTADYTFVDERLAQHYGIPNVAGPQFKRVHLTDPNRFGLLGKAGILTMTSLANRTSPVARGKYVMEVLIGSPPPPPPPSVPPLAEAVDNEELLSVRERMKQHRQSPACNSCHQIVDPIGMALENFDAVGAWRRTDGGHPIDPIGTFYDGSGLDGPSSVREAVLARSEGFLRSFTENLLAYGLGRVVDYRDMPTVRTIQRAAAESDNRFSSFIMGVVTSPPFRMRAASGGVNATEMQEHPH